MMQNLPYNAEIDGVQKIRTEYKQVTTGLENEEKLDIENKLRKLINSYIWMHF